MLALQQAHRLRNALQTALLLAGMGVLAALIGRMLLGPGATLWLVVMALVALWLAPGLSPVWMLRLYRARELSPAEAPALHRLVDELARRAELPASPRLFLVPSPILNAFATGSVERPFIAVTEGLLATMSLRELAGILAHEISHVRHRDLRVMMLADVISRLTASLATLGQLMLLLNLPLFLLSGQGLPWAPLLLLWAAPALMTLMQLGLSRTREFDADRGAAELTGDPMALASALAKLERAQGGWLKRILLPGQGVPEPSWLRTHPATEERIARLKELAREMRPAASLALDSQADADWRWGGQPLAQPRRRWWSGLWY